MANKIIMYTGNTCSKCKRAKAMLENCPASIELDERNVDENENFKIELTLCLSTTLPTFVINGNVYRGFDENIGKIMEELGL